jgi:RNA polymerase sigma-70 factor (ECF subfamily)
LNDALAVLPNERELVARATIKPAAFAAIFDHYFPRIYNYARYRVKQAEAADELTARVFESAFVNIGSYVPERAPFSAWLFGIARNTVNQYIRAQKRRRWISLDLIFDRKSDTPGPEEASILRETNAEVLSALSMLSDRDRDILALKFSAGLTNRRIASLSGLGESHVSVILYRAIKKLRTELMNVESNNE